ncbi:hypothetical protein V5799_020143 [Amblyomma americanum]|uniref:Uncharacterized protein n=1 Tax=Amblyomma americanum TaxID=6943 RepID=A0AAQ4EUW9_AMBAM
MSARLNIMPPSTDVEGDLKAVLKTSLPIRFLERFGMRDALAHFVRTASSGEGWTWIKKALKDPPVRGDGKHQTSSKVFNIRMIPLDLGKFDFSTSDF